MDRRKLIKKCDVEFSKYIRSYGECEKCGTDKNLQCAHIISRRHYSTRWDPENALCLCKRCHIYWMHKEPHEFVQWFDDKFGGDLYNQLKERANKVKKQDYEGIYKKFKKFNEF